MHATSSTIPSAIDGAVQIDTGFDSASPLPTPCEQAITDDEAALVWQSLEEIPETYRQPLVLFYREEHSIDRVAEALELSQDAGKQRLSRGRKLLRDRVASLVETALSRSRPGKTFTTAVLVALPVIAPQIATAGVAVTAAKGSTIAKTAAAVGLSGAILGPVIGLFGAWVGFKAGINATKSPRERQFTVKAAWITMALVMAFTVSLLAITFLWRDLASQNVAVFTCLLIALVCGYVITITALAHWVNRRAIQIRKEDGTYVEPQAVVGIQPEQLRKSAIFGGCSWMYIVAARVQDWLGLALVMGTTLGAFLLSSQTCLRNPWSYCRVLITMFGSLGVFTLIMMNWRWDLWFGSEIKNDTAGLYVRLGASDCSF